MMVELSSRTTTELSSKTMHELKTKMAELSSTTTIGLSSTTAMELSGEMTVVELQWNMTKVEQAAMMMSSISAAEDSYGV